MAFLRIPSIGIDGIAAAVPANTESNMDCEAVPEKDRRKLIQMTGIEQRHIVNDGTTAADLCQAAAEKLLDQMKGSREEIGLLVFVTQTPDYLIPCTSTILQDKLGLSKDTVCIDINLGCSGYVYGLANAAGMLSCMPGKKALVLVGDTSSAVISIKDKSVAPLFSDAGSATILAQRQGAVMDCHLQGDGAGYQAIWIPDGGARNWFSPDSGKEVQIDDDICRSRLDLILNGIDVFNFSMREVAPNISALMQRLEVTNDDIDYFIFHQANKLLNDSIRKKLGVEKEKMPLSLKDYGNTSSASIPVTLVSQLGEELRNSDLRLLLSGFGVGLSWGAALVRTDRICCPDMIEV